LLLEIEVLALPRALVRWTQELDDGDDPVAGADVEDLEEALRHGLIPHVDDLHHVDVRIHVAFASRRGLHEDSRVDAGAEVAWQGGLEPVAGIHDESLVDVAPAALEIGIHPREGAFHLEVSGVSLSPGVFSTVLCQEL
jgi:hypothetical protein